MRQPCHGRGSSLRLLLCDRDKSLRGENLYARNRHLSIRSAVAFKPLIRLGARLRLTRECLNCPKDVRLCRRL